MERCSGQLMRHLADGLVNRLDKSKCRAYQASQRGGEITCTLVDDRVLLEGGCLFFFEGIAEY